MFYSTFSLYVFLFFLSLPPPAIITHNCHLPPATAFFFLPYSSHNTNLLSYFFFYYHLNLSPLSLITPLSSFFLLLFFFSPLNGTYRYFISSFIVLLPSLHIFRSAKRVFLILAFIFIASFV